MIDLFFKLVFCEMVLILILSFKNPFRELTIMVLDRLKRGRRLVMVMRVIAGTIFVMLMLNVCNMMQMKRRLAISTDETLMGKPLLETSLMGFSLFLALMIGKLHHYIMKNMDKKLKIYQIKSEIADLNMGNMTKVMQKEKEISRLRSVVIHEDDIFDLKAKIQQLEFQCEMNAKQKVEQDEIVMSLKSKIKQLESQCEGKTKEAKAAEASVLALKKQSEGFLLEYDRLLDDNQSLRDQLQSFDRNLSRTDRKKNM